MKLLLRRHDVIVDEVGGVRFAAALMRRWVAEYQSTWHVNRKPLVHGTGASASFKLPADP